MHRTGIAFGLAVLVIIQAIGSPPASGASERDMIWSATKYDDASAGRETAVISYGIPETDAVKFSATCMTGSSGSFAATLINYNPGGLEDGETVSLTLSTDDYERQLQGEVYSTQLHDGVAGIRLDIDVASPFWDALARGNTLTYELDGKAPGSVGLKGSAKAVRRFIADCRSIFNLAGESSADSGTETGALSCEQFGQVKSEESETPVTVTFVNETEAHRGVLWINFEGRPVDYAALNAGESYTVDTYLSHPWMFTDGPGNCIEIYLPEADVARFAITAPNPVFGDGND